MEENEVMHEREDSSESCELDPEAVDRRTSSSVPLDMHYEPVPWYWNVTPPSSISFIYVLRIWQNLAVYKSVH